MGQPRVKISGRHLGTQHLTTQLIPALLDEVLRNQSDHGVRGDADVESRKASIEAQWAALLHDCHSTIERARILQLACGWVWLLRLHYALHEVERQREEGCEEACDGRCPKDLCLASLPHTTKSVLGGRIESQHTEIQCHCSCSCWHAACHETTGALVLHDQTYGLDDACVASSLGRGFHAVRLHANES